MPDMINLQPGQPEPMEGILDRFKNGRELLKLLNSGLVSEVLEIATLVPDGRYGEALVDVGDILDLRGLKEEAIAVRNLGTAATPKPYNWKAIAAAGTDLQKALILKYMGDGIPLMHKRIAVKDMTREEAQKWLSDNVANIREGRNAPLVRRYLGRNAPEVLDALDGKVPTMGITAEQADKWIKILGWAIFLASASSIFTGAAGLAVATALRAIQVRLKTMFPEVSAVLEGFEADGVDRGLDLSDFSVMA